MASSLEQKLLSTQRKMNELHVHLAHLEYESDRLEASRHKPNDFDTELKILEKDKDYMWSKIKSLQRDVNTLQDSVRRSRKMKK